MSLRAWLSKARPQKLPFRRRVTRAAVALIEREGRDGRELFFIQRARRKGDPWSGDMAFPGKPLLVLQTGQSLRLEAMVREGLISNVRV